MPVAELEDLSNFRTSHLAWPLWPEELTDLPPDEAQAYLLMRKNRILQSEADPLKHGYVPEIWKMVDEQIAQLRAKFPTGVLKIIIWGGNRSGKTRKASNYVLQDIVKNEGHRWWCCDSTEAMARTNQMRLLWEQMPQEWRNLDRDQITDMRYSLSDGFPKNTFVTPKKSEVSFKFYSMDVAN